MSENERKVKKKNETNPKRQSSGRSNKALTNGQKKAIGIIALVFLCIIFVLSIYTPAGSVGIGLGIRNLCKGLLGVAAYTLPVACIGVLIHMLAHKDKENRYVFHYISAFLLVIFLASLMHIVMHDAVMQHHVQAGAGVPNGTIPQGKISVTDCFRAGIAGVGGGFLGGGFALLLLLMFHPVLATIVLCALIAVTLVVLTKFRLSRLLFGKLYRWLKNCWDEEMEIRRAEKEEKKRKKEEESQEKESTDAEIALPEKKKRHRKDESSSIEQEAPELLTEVDRNKRRPKKNKDVYDPFTDEDLLDDAPPEKTEILPTEESTNEDIIIPGTEEVIFDDKPIPVIYGVQIDMEGVRHTDIAGDDEDDRPKIDKDAADIDPDVESEEEEEIEKPYEYPTTDIMSPVARDENEQKPEELRAQAQVLTKTLESFGVQTRVLEIRQGPTVTRFELAPQAGVRVSRITGLADDIALSLAATAVRIEAPIPGKAAVGIEIPNPKISVVHLREVLESKAFVESTSKLTFAVGKDITGTCIVGDVAKMPHLLIAGQTGSGKSVCLNGLIASIIFKASPNEVKMIMIDPKVVELGVYNGIPHLMIPVVTDPKKAANALSWAVGEMQNRYKMFENWHVRNIQGYNELAAKEGFKPMEQIVIIIDELADLMMVASKEVEDSICRLAQLARAAGMHLIVATQRPSVNVITGVIKANIPSRIAFSVASFVDSRTILDCGGAEKLLGRGDMLYYPSGAGKPIRLQGAYVSDQDIESIVSFVKTGQTPRYDEDIIEKIETIVPTSGEEDAGDADELLSKAIELVVEAGQASTSYLQRRLKVGYSRAGRIMDQMEERGIIGPPEGAKPRAVLISRQEMYDMMINIDEDEE